MYFLTHLSVSKMESAKNKQAVKNKQEEIKKAAAAIRASGWSLLAQAPHASKNRKHTPDVQLSGKGTDGLSVPPYVREGAIDPPCHGVGKGLMTS